MIIMGMYEDIHTSVSETVTIMGVPFYAENISAEEPVNRREREFTSIIGGTERVSQGKYIHREFSFTTTIFFPTGRPDAYDSTFKKMMSKPVKVTSKYMGGTFNAMIKITPTFPENSPNHMELDVTVTEVPGVNSNIDGEKKLTVPKVEKIKTKVTKKSSKSSTKSKTKTKKNKSKRKSKTKKNK
ncbi:hypothetical protein [Methanobrevibacter sp.]